MQKEQFTNIDNDTMYIDKVVLGAVTEIDTGTRGTCYFDAFESRSDGYIGLVAALRFPDALLQTLEPPFSWCGTELESLMTTDGSRIEYESVRYPIARQKRKHITYASTFCIMITLRGKLRIRSINLYAQEFEDGSRGKNP
ncbi:MAG: hypothetical protein U9R58_10020 [Chloroflexota bacterium]|nr:hypothetical protein [Chloroflexota bacterium]